MAISALQTNGAVASSLAYASSITAGSSLWVVAFWNDPGTSCTAAGSHNGALTSRGVMRDTLNGIWYQQFTLDNALAGAETITLTVTGSPGAVALVIQEIGGTSGYDTQASTVSIAPGTGTDAITTSNLLFSVQPGLLCGVAINITGTGTPAPTSGTGFTSAGTFFNVGGGNTARVENLRYTSTTPIPATFTATTGNGGVTYGVLAAAFAELGAVAITGQTATFSQGTFSTPAMPIQAAPLSPLIGNKTFGPLGMAGFALRSYPNVQAATGNTVSIASLTGTFTQGTFTASSSGTQAMGSQTATFSQGTLTGSTSAGGTVALSGQTATFTQGAFSASTTGAAALGSQIATFSQGTLTASTSGAAGLGSQAATFTQGAMTSSTSAGGSVALGSQTATFAQGTFTVAGGPLPGITCSGGSFDSLTPTSGLTL